MILLFFKITSSILDVNKIYYKIIIIITIIIIIIIIIITIIIAIAIIVITVVNIITVLNYEIFAACYQLSYIYIFFH